MYFFRRRLVYTYIGDHQTRQFQSRDSSVFSGQGRLKLSVLILCHLYRIMNDVIN
jgi:hypothetical protein